MIKSFKRGKNAAPLQEESAMERTTDKEREMEQQNEKVRKGESSSKVFRHGRCSATRQWFHRCRSSQPHWAASTIADAPSPARLGRQRSMQPRRSAAPALAIATIGPVWLSPNSMLFNIFEVALLSRPKFLSPPLLKTKYAASAMATMRHINTETMAEKNKKNKETWVIDIEKEYEFYDPSEHELKLEKKCIYKWPSDLARTSSMSMHRTPHMASLGPYPPWGGAPAAHGELEKESSLPDPQEVRGPTN
ncbi:hypothetical protein EJ110_NYTH52810 [Nymphaea thermarum]|nr:hypothetical protein EJ110_NYTH52810 [Nymphaea thermarum]